MPLPTSMSDRLKARQTSTTVTVKRGFAIFDDTDYPRDFAGFVGQVGAKRQIAAAIASANARRTNLEHVMLASGLHGVGKTTLAHIIAYQAGVGLASVSGPITVEDIRPVLRSMSDGDILFWDEIHLAVAGNRNRADWMLPFLISGELITSSGAEQMPKVTVIGATTDVGKLPNTLISRFMVKPKLVPYTPAEAVEIARSLSARMSIPTKQSEREIIASASNGNPRDMRSILVAMRDQTFEPGNLTGTVDMDLALQWAGFTRDGLTDVAVDMLLILLMSKNHTCSEQGIAAQLGEPGPLRHHEQLLLQKGLLSITGRGRTLTPEGADRALEIARERHPA
jgi:Holliday junction DNA helicase RuvB